MIMITYSYEYDNMVTALMALFHDTENTGWMHDQIQNNPSRELITVVYSMVRFPLYTSCMIHVLCLMGTTY